LDRFPFHHFKVQNSFRLRPYHDFECITVRMLLQHRIGFSIKIFESKRQRTGTEFCILILWHVSRK
jgi:hypothetical protein